MESEKKVCAYVVAKRKRRCRMMAAAGSVYCGEHLIHDKEHQCTDERARRRIACPLDPSHTVFEDVLGRHVKRCNAAKRVLPACYSPAINKDPASSSSSSPAPPTTTQVPRPLSAYPTQCIEDFVKKVEVAYKACDVDVKEAFLQHPSMAAQLSDPANGMAALKHLRQQSSLLSQLEGRGLLDPTSVGCYVEFGAGRGKLTGCIHRALQATLPVPKSAESAIHYVLVDRSSCRRKVDGAHSVLSNLAGATSHRLLMDIADLDLSRVEAVRGRGTVGVAKHLCGSATDLALRCIISTLNDDGGKRSEVSGGGRGHSGGTRVQGVAIALCCHHRCTWAELVGRDFLARLGFTPQDFDLLSHMTSWAICGQRPPDTHQHEERRWGYVPHPNEGVGLKCKRLLDMARVEYLRQNGLRAELLYYVERDVSLENVLLLATANHHNDTTETIDTADHK